MKKNFFIGISKFAFSLAEILIVIGIIGIIAEITIPTLINSYQKDATVTKLKKVYTNLYQAVKLSENDNGPTSDWDNVTIHDSGALESWFKTYLAPYMKYLKTTQDATNFLNAAGCLDVYLSDGTILQFWNNDGQQFHVYVYLNGLNKTTMGRDVFLFFVGSYPQTMVNYFGIKNNYEVRPYDYSNTAITTPATRDFWLNNVDYGCNKNVSNKSYCAGLIMYDNWKIPDDYPYFN